MVNCEHIKVLWFEDRDQAYESLCDERASPEWIERSRKARDNRGSGGAHTMGGDGYLRLAQCMVRSVL